MSDVNNEKHDHEHERTQDVLMYIRAAIDSLHNIENMISNQKFCANVVQQLSGTMARLAECRNIVVQDHISSCIRPALKSGQEKVINEVDQIFKQMVKWSGSAGSHH